MFKRKKLKIFSFFLMVITIVFSVFWVKMKIKEDCLRVREQYFNAEYKGVVDEKFKDKENHAAKTLIIKGKTEKTVFRKYRDKSDLYEYARIGDSIYKPKESLKVKVIREKKETVFIIDLDCDDL